MTTEPTIDLAKKWLPGIDYFLHTSLFSTTTVPYIMRDLSDGF